jgi:hypothetical protein
MEFLTDPKVAPLAWMLPLLAFCWVMFHQLTNNGESHIWWVGLLAKVKLADKDTTDYEHPVNASKLIFKWLAVIAGTLVLYQTFVIVQQYNPTFWGLGPKPVKLTGTEGQPGKLPQRIPGMGGGGKTGGSGQGRPGAPSAAPADGSTIEQHQPNTIQPGEPAPPSIPGGIQPGAAPAGSGGLAQPQGQPGSLQPGTPINPMGGPAGSGGGGQFNPAIR